MKSLLSKVFFSFIIAASMVYCSSTKNNVVDKNIHSETDTIKIVNEEEEYEIIIIDPGFNTWLITNARPRGFYSQSYLEIKNQIYVNNWNIRVFQPTRYSGDLYCMRIDYNTNIDYGYEVNYLLYNYFMYFQKKYRQNLR
ncbi:DUF6146 family protein [Wenyingzhuangia sp. 1_MG-2023]|nr:DUF6146 family protein [Wenyingzhuangia sp. 1_MG-2023]